jgi:hypothetical protein
MYEKIILTKQPDGRWYGRMVGSDDGHGNEIDSAGDTPAECLENLLSN